MSRDGDKAVKRADARFVIASGLPYQVRAALIITLIAAGFAMQLFLQWLIPGVVMIAIGSLLGSVKGVKSEPKSIHGKSEWKEVLPEQWRHASELSKKAARWKSDFTNINSAPGIFLTILLAVGGGIIFGITMDYDIELGFVFAADVIALFAPLMFVGTLKAWEPPKLNIKLKALLNVLDALEKSSQPDILFQPMLEVAAGAKADSEGVPLDARLMIRFKEAPENFYGVQVQVSINQVQNVNYPYLYAVILYKKEFPVDEDAVSFPATSWLVIEPSLEGEVVVIVMRQKTTKTSGYHTKEPRQIEIVDTAVGQARKILHAAN